MVSGYQSVLGGTKGWKRGWSQTDFVELWSISSPRLAEMAMEISVMCQLMKNNLKPHQFDETSRFESLFRYSQIPVSEITSERGNGKRPALSRKRSVVLNIWQYRPTQSVMYVPLLVNRFAECFLLIVQYRYLKSCCGDFYSPESDPPHKIMRYWFYCSIWLGFSFPPDRICQVEMICIGGVPVSKRHFGGAGP